MTNFSLIPDIERENLKQQIKLLETDLNNLTNQKADLEKLIHEFSVRHNIELGELLVKILEYRKIKAKGTELEANTEEDYNTYNKQFEALREEHITQLTDDEQKELKEKYRKASKMCHPDVVSEEQKELATKIFAELSSAYEKSDLNKIREILNNLENGNFFLSKSDTINQKQLFEIEIEKLKIKISELNAEIEEIKNGETYKTIEQIDSWDTYFMNAKNNLKTQLNKLKNE
jgi:hypothetical protein